MAFPAHPSAGPSSYARPAVDSPSTPSTSTSRNPKRELRAALQALPPISAPPRLNLRPAADLERELPLWQAACNVGYVVFRSQDLSGQERAEMEPRVVKAVGQTMRILLELGAVDAARELDRVFYTTKPGRRGEKRNMGEEAREKRARRRQASGEEEGRTLLPSRWSRRMGLGLPRGNLRVAWMASFAVRLENAIASGDGQALREFGELLREVYEAPSVSLASPEGAVKEDDGGMDTSGPAGDSCLLAFLTRKIGVVQEQLAAIATEKEGVDGTSEMRVQIQHLLQRIKDAEANQVEVVSFALLETGLEHLEKLEGNPINDPWFAKVEEDIQRLVGSLEANNELRKLHNLLLSYTSSVDRHAHILHLAVRFLLLRHPYHDPTSSAVSPLHSAAQLYYHLLDLTRRVDPANHEDLASLRQRQTSALYRILAMHTAELAGDESGQRTVPLASRALDLLDTSLPCLMPLLSAPAPKPAIPEWVQAPPPDPRILGVSVRFFRRLFFSLTRHVPSISPSDSPSPPSTDSASLRTYTAVAPYSLLSRAMRTMTAAREHDASLSPSKPFLFSAEDVKKRERERGQLLDHEKPLFQQPNLAYVLVRSALTSAPEDPPRLERYAASAAQQTREEDSPLARLSALFDFVSALERTTPGEVGERKARRLVAKAIRVAIHEQFAGDAAALWRGMVEEVVDEWENARDWVEVRRQVEEREAREKELFERFIRWKNQEAGDKWARQRQIEHLSETPEERQGRLELGRQRQAASEQSRGQKASRPSSPPPSTASPPSSRQPPHSSSLASRLPFFSRSAPSESS
ncbi:hypothetical protein JCM10213v2_005876 [Rhodosporidiobolus nylandii]